MIEKLPTRPRLVFVSTEAESAVLTKGAVRAAMDALTLVSTGRPQMALALLEKLPALIEAEIGAA